MKPEKLLEAEGLMELSHRFAKHPDLAGKKALQQRFMGQYRNARLLAAIREKGMPSVMPVGLVFQQHTAQTWPQAQREWLDKNQGK